MDFKKTVEQEKMLKDLQELIARECPENYLSKNDENHTYPDTFVKAFYDSGFGMMGIPEQYGGRKFDIQSLAMICEEVSRLGIPPYLCGAILVSNQLLELCTEEQIQKAVECAKQGKQALCLGFTEPQAGSDSAALTTSYTRKNGKVYLNGNKTFITGAKIAPYMFCMAKDPDAPPAKAFSMWFVLLDAPGIKINALKKVGVNMVETCQVYLDNVELEEKDLIGVEGKGFIQLMKNFENERLIASAGAVGAATGAYEDTLGCVNHRIHSGEPQSSNKVIQGKLTNMAIKIENMRNMIYKASWERDNGIFNLTAPALAKLYCAQTSFEVIDDALQILGGQGYAAANRVTRFWRDARLFRIAGGSDQVMVHIVGRELLRKYA